MARATVMTPEVIAKLEVAFAWGCWDLPRFADILTGQLRLAGEDALMGLQRR